MKHAKPSVSVNRPNVRILVAALLAVAFIATFFGVFSAKADNNAAPASQQVIGRSMECKLNTASSCVISHGLGVKPTAVVVTPGGPGQNATVDITKITDQTFTVKFLWHDGKGWAAGTLIRFNVIYTFVGGVTPTTPPVTSATPTVTPTVSTPPTTTPTVAPTAIAYKCDPTNTVAHFYPSGSNTTGNGSDSIGDPYNASAEHWAVNDDFRSNMCVYSKDKWYVEAKSINDGGMVQAYPSMRLIYHDWGSDTFANDPKLSSFPQLKAEVAVTDPANCTGCIYNDAFDVWLNGIGGDAPELMIWTHNNGQSPYGPKKASNITIDGRQWDLYNSGSYIAYVPTNNDDIKSGTYDLKAFINDLVAREIVPADPKVGQVSYGVEVVSTGTGSNPPFRRWDFTKFNVLDK